MIVAGESLTLELDERRGVVTRLQASERPAINFAATTETLSYPSMRANGPWLGDLAFQVWDGEGWRREETADSEGVRDVDGGVVAHRLPTIAIRQRWWFADDVLRWSIELTNQRDVVIELGEVALAFVMNTDYTGVFAGSPPHERAGGRLQREWHEQRLIQHLHVAGHSSYAILQRPAGDGPLLLFAPCEDTALEAAYQIDPTIGNQWSTTFDGPYYLAIHSRAARLTQGWLANRERQSSWFHGHTSLLLEPGAAHRLNFRFSLLQDAGEVADDLVGAGQVAVDVAPGMVAPVGEPIELRLRAPGTPTLLPEEGGIEIEALPEHRYRLRCRSGGQKPILVRYGEGRWTRLLFYATPPARELLCARAAFIVAEQYYENPFDPFGRHHAFLPYDDHRQSVYLDSEETWQVGASDEYGLPIAMFLAEKNVHQPDAGQVAILERYVDDFLHRVLQDPETLEVRLGMYFAPQLPSSREHEWSEERSRTTVRAMNYPLVANIYHALYRVAKLHGLTRSRSAAEYLSLAWRTAAVGFEIGNLNTTGAPAGANLLELLDDLADDDPAGHATLGEHLRRFADIAAADPYPFGSELYIDQTAHGQVFAALAHYGHDERALDAVRVTRALRSGAPSWYRYGNDQRGSVCCWYGTPQNSRVLLEGYERTQEPELLRLGYGGLTSFLTTVRGNGAARGWFTWWPDRTGFDSRSLDTDLGLYGYLKAAKAFVVDDPIFGLVGYGCRVTVEPDGALVAVPWDGLGKRLRVEPASLDVSVTKGEIERLWLAGDRRLLVIDLADPSGLLDEYAFDVRGIAVASATAVVGGRREPLSVVDGRIVVAGPGAAALELQCR